MDAVAPSTPKDPAGGTGPVEHYGRFIPLTRDAAIAHVLDRAGAEADVLALLAVRLHELRHRQYLALARRLRRCYLPFSPDRDTIRGATLPAEERHARESEFAGIVGDLLKRANYVSLCEADINRIITASEPFSLRVSVDLSEYAFFALHYRDEYTETTEYRRPDRLYLVKARKEVACFRRLFLFLKLKDEEERVREVMAERRVPERRARRLVARKRRFLPKGASSDFVYVKLFRDLPEHDVQILFPNREVRFRPFDKLKFGVTAGGGTAFGLFSTTGKLAAATSPFAVAGAMAGLVALVARQVTSFFNHRTRYMAELAQKLFFHNLANNRAALALMLDRAEEEEFKEDLFAIAALAGRTVDGTGIAAAKAAVERDLLSTHRAAVDFEIDDALARLERDGLLDRTDDGRILVPPAGQILTRVDAANGAFIRGSAAEAAAGTDPADRIAEETV